MPDGDGEADALAACADPAATAALPVRTPRPAESVDALRAAAAATLFQRVVLDDGAFDAGAGADDDPRWAAAALVREGGRTLLVRPAAYDGWITPGGGVEAGESLWATAAREDGIERIAWHRRLPAATLDRPLLSSLRRAGNGE